MGKRTEHAPGTFSWAELATSDPEGAKAFYGELLGWEYEDNEVPGGGVYTMCQVQGDAAAAITSQPDADPSPPHFNSYVTVESADDSAARASSLGATVLMDPFDVMEAGRMAVIADPAGAAFSIWEPREAIGANRVNDPGCLTWNELHTQDVDAALAFYEGLFGWGREEMDTQGGPRYVLIKVGERMNGGVMELQGEMPPNWLPYFTVESRDASADKATSLGGAEHHRMDMPAGKIAMATDPQGAPFALFEGDIDD